MQFGCKIAADAQKEDSHGQQLKTVTPAGFKQIEYLLLYVDIASTRDEKFMRTMENNEGLETWLGAAGTSLSLGDDIVVQRMVTGTPPISRQR